MILLGFAVGPDHRDDRPEASAVHIQLHTRGGTGPKRPQRCQEHGRRARQTNRRPTPRNHFPPRSTSSFFLISPWIFKQFPVRDHILSA